MYSAIAFKTLFNFVVFSRSCEGISRVVSCKETFNLYYLPSNGENEARASHMDVKTYTKVRIV